VLNNLGQVARKADRSRATSPSSSPARSNQDRQALRASSTPSEQVNLVGDVDPAAIRAGMPPDLEPFAERAPLQ
jgi:hypothetical protein